MGGAEVQEGASTHEFSSSVYSGSALAPRYFFPTSCQCVLSSHHLLL
jgi:hypothetical protein